MRARLIGGGALILRHAERVAARTNNTEMAAECQAIRDGDGGMEALGAAALADVGSDHPIRDAIAALLSNPEALAALIKAIASIFMGG